MRDLFGSSLVLHDSPSPTPSSDAPEASGVDTDHVGSVINVPPPSEDDILELDGDDLPTRPTTPRTPVLVVDLEPPLPESEPDVPPPPPVDIVEDSPSSPPPDAVIVEAQASVFEASRGNMLWPSEKNTWGDLVEREDELARIRADSARAQPGTSTGGVTPRDYPARRDRVSSEESATPRRHSRFVPERQSADAVAEVLPVPAFGNRSVERARQVPNMDNLLYFERQFARKRPGTKWQAWYAIYAETWHTLFASEITLCPRAIALMNQLTCVSNSSRCGKLMACGLVMVPRIPPPGSIVRKAGPGTRSRVVSATPVGWNFCSISS